MRALITGASGFIGSHLTEKLLRKGFETDCLTRNTANPGWLKDLDVNLIQGDCSDENFLFNHVRNYDYIFHLSGLTKTSSPDDFYSVNSNGAENIINAVVRKNPNIKRFVYLSSLSAFGPRVNNKMPTEDQEPLPVSHYGKSKLKGEGAVLRHSDIIPVSILRPSAVYGPRDREIFLLFKCVKKGLFPYWGKGSTSMIYVDDLITAIVAAAESDNAVGRTYFISDGAVYTNENIVKEMASVLGVMPLKIKVPRSFLPAIGFFGEKISKIVGTNTMINRDKIKELMYTDWICDITRARNELSFEPKVGIKEGIKWTADWYKIHKWL